MIYLDSAATTLLKPAAVGRAVLRAMAECASPGRAGHLAARQAEEAVYNCRILAGELFGAEPEQVVFTQNATHGLNLAIKSLVRPGDRVVISGFEHNAVTRPLHALGARVTVAGQRLFDRADTLADFRRSLGPEVRAVVCTQVSNVFGYALPVAEIAALCREKAIPLIVDASQGAGILPISLKDWGAAYVAMPGHKGLYGPQGTGLLLCAPDRQPKTLLEGGTGSESENQAMPELLPDRLEAGTHNVPGICGLYEGLRFVQKLTPQVILAHEQSLTARLGAALEGVPNLTCCLGPSQTGVVSLQSRTWDCETLAAALDEKGIAVRAGLHCAPTAHRSAGTLERGTVRLSFCAFTTGDDADRAGEALRELHL